MAVSNSEKNAQNLLNKRVGKGGEIEHFNAIQGQIASVQAEQRNLLNEQRTISSMEVQNNQLLAQGAGILAAESGSGSPVTPMSVNPTTNAILSKYGVGKPGKVTKTTHNTIQSQSPQKINVTNNTSTTNNIQIAQPSIPLATPNIPMRAGKPKVNNDSNRFKVWVNNAFAKQNEAASIREKEYKKREWSLTKTTNKLISKMGDIGKTIGKAVNPARVSSMMGDQLKILLFLMGFQYVANNIKSILEKVDGFLYWITGGSYGVKLPGGTGKSALDSLVSIFGGDKNKTFLQNLEGLFSGLFNNLGDRISNLFTARKEAISQIKFPDIDLTAGLPAVLTTVGQYLGDVISAALTGSSAVSRSVARDISNAGSSSMREHYDDRYSHTQDAKGYIKTRTGVDDNMSLGDAVLTVDGFKQNFKMADRDYNMTGGLSNGVGSSVKMSTYLTNRNNIGTDQVIHGLSTLKKTAKSKNEILVPGEFLDYLGNFYNIRGITDRIKLTAKWVKVRYILVKKTMAEMNSENCGEFMDTFAKEYIENKVYATVPGGGVGYLETVAGEFKRGNIVTGTVNAIFGWNGGMRSFISATGASWRNGAHDDYTVMMVRNDDDRYDYYLYPSLKDSSGKPLTDEYNNTYLVLTHQNIKEIEKCVKDTHKISNFSFDMDNVESVSLTNSLSENHLNPGQLRRVDMVGDLRALENRLASEEGTINFFNEFNNSNPFHNDESKYKGEIEKEKYSGLNDKLIENKNLINKLYSRLGNSGLGLTAAQIAGLIGNIGAESGFNPGATGDIRDGKPTAFGLCQWRGTRLAEFQGLYNELPNANNEDKQIDFIIHELKNTYPDVLEKILNTKGSDVDSSIAAKAWMDHYERPHQSVVDAEYSGKNAPRQLYAAGAYALRQQDLVNNGITEQLDLGNQYNKKLGGRTTAIYDFVNYNKESQVLFNRDENGNITSVVDGNGKVLNGLYTGNLGNTEVNLANSVIRGDKGFSYSSLIMHDRIRKSNPDEIEDYGRRLGYFDKNVSTAIKDPTGNNLEYVLARMLTNIVGISTESILNLDWIQLLKLYIQHKVYEYPISSLISKYYLEDAFSGHQRFATYHVLKALTFIIGVLNNGNTDILIDKFKEYLEKKTKDTFLNNAIHYDDDYWDTLGLKTSENDKLKDAVFYEIPSRGKYRYRRVNYVTSNISDNITTAFFVIFENGWARGKNEDIPPMNEVYIPTRNAAAGRGQSDFEKYKLSIECMYSNNTDLSNGLFAAMTTIYNGIITTKLKDLNLELDANFLKTNNIDLDTYIYRRLSETNPTFLKTLGKFTDGGDKAMKNLEWTYSISKLGQQANINEYNRVKGLTDLARTQLEQMNLEQQKKIAVAKLVVDAVGENNVSEAKNEDGGYKFSLLRDKFKEIYHLEDLDYSKLDDTQKGRYSTLANMLSTEGVDVVEGDKSNSDVVVEDLNEFENLKATGMLARDHVYAVSDGKGGYTRYKVSADKNNRVNKKYKIGDKYYTVDELFSQDYSKDTEGYRVQQSVLENLATSIEADKYGIDTSNFENMTEITATKYTLDKIRNQFGLSDEIVNAKDPVKSWQDHAKKMGWLDKNGNHTETMKELADRIATAYEIKGSDGTVDTGAKDVLLQKDKSGLTPLEQILLYGSKSDYYKEHIEKRKKKDDGSWDRLDHEKSSLEYRDTYRAASADMKGMLRAGKINGEISDYVANSTSMVASGMDAENPKKSTIINVEETLHRLASMKYVNLDKVSNNITPQVLRDKFGINDPADQSILQAMLTGNDEVNVLNNNTIVNGQYLKAMAQLLAIIATQGAHTDNLKKWNFDEGKIYEANENTEANN